MKKSSILFGAAALLLILSSCSTTQPLSVSAAPIGSKVGVSATGVLFGVYMHKGFGIAEAAHNGKITGGVGVADMKTTRYVGRVYFRKEIIVYGN